MPEKKKKNAAACDTCSIIYETALAPRQGINFVGITYNTKMTFKTHVKRLAGTAEGKLASLRGLFDDKGSELFFKAQILSSLE